MHFKAKNRGILNAISFAINHIDQPRNKKKEGRWASPLFECSALERESHTDFVDSGSVGFFDVAVGAVSLECRIVRIAVIQIATGIRIDKVATAAEEIEDIEIGADGESISEAESLLHSHIECRDRGTASQSILFSRNIGVGITGVLVAGVIWNVDIDGSTQTRRCRE